MFDVLPIDGLLPAIADALAKSSTLVLQAPPGAGKTTRVPLALLTASWLADRRILLLEPRRLAARAAAIRMASLLNEPLGQTVGYCTRFDRQVSRHTRIEVLTEGILTRRLQRDPALEEAGLVIFDEFHERSLHADLALALCLDSQRGLRKDLRLLVMSATLEGEAIARLLGNAPIITSTGRTYPVTVHYSPHEARRFDFEAVSRAVQLALTQQSGDILVFLPGSGEIRQTQQRLATALAGAEVRLTPLYGDLPDAEQQQAIQADPHGRRKVVLATSIAETSLTLEGIGVVIDSGWTRVPRFDPRRGLTRLTTVRVSADTAEQRAGRAGRLGPGVCYRLWSEASHRRLRPHRTPEILDADLAPLALELSRWGVTEPMSLDWLDPPPTSALAQARDLLRTLEVLDSRDHLTPIGQALAELPTHPRLAHLLRCGSELNLASLAADLVALLEERDLLRGAHDFGSDLTIRLEALQAFRRDGPQSVQRWQADPITCARVDYSARRWRQWLKASIAEVNTTVTPTMVGLLVALAYPDRIAQQRDGGNGRYLLAHGRGAQLPTSDPLTGSAWLAVADLDAGASEGRIWLAAPLNPSDLERWLASQVRTVSEVIWDERQAAVIARQEQRFGALVLTGRRVANPDPAALQQAMLAGIAQMGLDCLPWTAELRDWQARVLSLRHWFPQQAWPELSDSWLTEHLAEWLSPWLDGITRREHLARLDLAAALHNLLDGPRQAALNRLAPPFLQVPSGSRLRLRYQPGEAPVLAVKLQELFGLADTPRIAEGQIPVTLHLLSPAQRPIQITQDLHSFWVRTYPEVKKELKGRYPKHPWPEDPWTATPTRRTQTIRQPRSG